MKKIVLIFTLVFFGLIAKSQVWGDFGSTWHYSYWNIGEGGFIKIQFSGDTVIQNRNCQKLEFMKYRFFSIPNAGMIFAGTIPINTEFTSVSGDTVFYLVKNNFRILYNFNAQVGDSWDLGVDTNDNFMCSKSIVVVDSIGTMLINNKTFRWLYLRSVDSSSVVLNGKVIEGIGSVNEFLFPVIHNCNPAICPEIDNMQFLCFGSENMGIYNPLNSICEPYLGVETNSFDEINIYPNPATDFLQIENISDKTIISIFSMDGKIQKSITLSDNGIVNINDLAEGIYIIKLQTEKGVIYRKFIKQ
jgi:hypothetical protein